jgi:hypothetical protein
MYIMAPQLQINSFLYKYYLLNTLIVIIFSHSASTLNMATAKSTFVFVQGLAWPKAFQEVAALLANKGYPRAFVTLASVGVEPPLTGFEKDVDAVEKTAGKLIHTSEDVILMMHSYGGLPSCQAMASIMDNNERGNWKGRVLRMVWLCGFVLREGGSFFQGVEQEGSSMVDC